MTETEKRTAATKFYNDWRGIGNEKSDSQRFWIEFLSNVLGIEDVTQIRTWVKKCRSQTERCVRLLSRHAIMHNG